MLAELDFSFDRPVTAADFRALADQTDWARARDESEIAAALKGCYAILGAWDGDRLVAIVRLISDGVYVAQFLDVIVDRAYRGQGVGSKLVRRALDRCAHIESVTLSCGPEQVPFYQRLGFTEGPRMSRRPGKPNPGDAPLA